MDPLVTVIAPARPPAYASRWFPMSSVALPHFGMESYAIVSNSMLRGGLQPFSMDARAAGWISIPVKNLEN